MCTTLYTHAQIQATLPPSFLNLCVHVYDINKTSLCACVYMYMHVHVCAHAAIVVLQVVCGNSFTVTAGT